MTDSHAKINAHLTETSKRTTKCQHEALDTLLGEIAIYRASLRTKPDNGCARVETLKNMQSLIGMLACADGRQTIVRETRQAVNVDGILAPSFEEMIQAEEAEEREGLVNEVLAAADGLVDQGLVPRNAQAARAVAELEAAVHDLFRFDEELDESDDDDDTDEDTQPDVLRSVDFGCKPGQGIIILPPALTMGEKKDLEAFFRSLGISI